MVDGRLYTGQLKRATKAIGLHTHLKSLYWGLEIPRHLHRLSPNTEITHEIAGVPVRLPLEEYWQYQRFRWMHPEIGMFEELVAELEAGDVFYDVGAHLGWHTAVAASIDPDVEVVAFEPHPTIARRLEAVLECTAHDVDVRQVALAETAGTVEFSADPTAGAHISGARGEELTDTIPVQTVAGDSLVDEELTPPDILKIDAEGVEAAVLRGLGETITEHRPRIIYCEFHEGQREVRALFEAFGYDCERFKASRPLLKAVPRPR